MDYDDMDAGETEFERRLAVLRRWLMAGIVLSVGFFLWLIFFSNRYQTLCQVHFWSATAAQLQACDEAQSQLDGR